MIESHPVMNFRSKKWTVVLLLLLIILSIGIFIKFAFGTDAFSQNIRSMFLGSVSQNPFRKQSNVKVSLVDSKLNLSFDLTDEDQPKLTSFVNNWFGVSEEVRTLSLGVDDNLSAILAANVPIDLNLKISNKSLEFNSRATAALQNALIKSDIEFATGSSKLNVEYSDSSKYKVKIEDPAVLANYATESGKLAASTKIARLFQTLPKVATIELNVNGRSVAGKIVLK